MWLKYTHIIFSILLVIIWAGECTQAWFGVSYQKISSCPQSKTNLQGLKVVRRTPTARVLLHWVIISRRWEQNQTHDRERSINTDFPRTTKVLRFSGRTAKFQAPKTPRTDTILPEHLLTHTLIIYVYSHYCIWSFCHHFPCKNDVLITSTRVSSLLRSHFQTPKTCQSLTQTFYLLLAAVLPIYDIVMVY